VDEVVLCFDSDEAGQNAAIRSLDHLLASGLAVRVAVVPAPHDPDSFIKANGGEVFRKLVESAEGFFDYYLNRLCAQSDVKTDKGRLAVSRAMADAIQKIGNAILIDTYSKKTALRLGVTPESVRAEFKKTSVTGNPPASNEVEAVPAEQETQRRSPHEFHLLKLLLLHDDLVAWTALHLDVNWISHPHVRQITERRLAAQTNENWKNLGAFLGECDSPEMRNLITEAVAEDRKIPNPETQMADVTLKLRNQFLDRQIAALTQKAAQSEVSEDKKLGLLHEQQKLREQKRAPLSPLLN
jgi:DNA primase